MTGSSGPTKISDLTGTSKITGSSEITEDSVVIISLNTCIFNFRIAIIKLMKNRNTKNKVATIRIEFDVIYNKIIFLTILNIK